MSEDFNAKMKLLIKSEKAMLRLEMKKKGRQTFWIALALLAVLVTLVLLNVTVYLYLAQTNTPLVSAAILTGINLAVALLFLFVSTRQENADEAKAIEEIRNFAWEQVSTDIDDVKQGVSDFKESVVKVKKSVDGLTSGTAFGLNKVMPVLTTLIELNKKK